MALRRQTTTQPLLRLATVLCMLIGALATATAQDYTFAVRHRRWHGGTSGTLHISAASIAFEEKVNGANAHPLEWRYEEIQQLTLARNELRILTYEDSNWKLGRDREYIFDHL